MDRGTSERTAAQDVRHEPGENMFGEHQSVLQEYLVAKFRSWQPREAAVLGRTKRSVTLQWLDEEPFGFMRHHLIFKVQRKEKMPPWVTVYSGGKTMKTIEDLAPSHPHKFRLRVILRATAVSLLAEEAVKCYGDENTIYANMTSIDDHCDEVAIKKNGDGAPVQTSGASLIKSDGTLQEVLEIPKEKLESFPAALEVAEQYITGNKKDYKRKETNDTTLMARFPITADDKGRSSRWLESRWSEETWTSTDTGGTSAACFCMAVRCGYFKQVQVMLEERPILIEAINSVSGLTPLATAVKKGDVNAVKFVLSLGAEVDQPTATSQTPLHLAVLAGDVAVTDVLLEKGANFQAQDFNGLRVEHYAVDSCKLAMVKHVMGRGGDVHVKDNNGWTPLFRAVCQGADTAVIEELVSRGSRVDVTDRRGLALVGAARLLANRQGRRRDSVLRLVDAQFPHEKALANFTRLTKKIYSVHTLLK